nr:hypothetical protein [Tanacetum cinerariifolium]
DVTNLASSVVVDPVATKRVNTIHPQSQILRELQSPVQTRSKVQKSKFAEMLHQVEIETRRNLVLAAGDPAGSIVSTGGVPAGSVPTSSVHAGGVLAGGV